MKAFSLRVIALASIPAFGACADTGTTEPTGPGFEITVAPLDLPGIGDACYDITVSNGTDNVVVLTDICSGQYGNGTGGDITYIAPCDSTVDSDGDAGNGIQNSVTVWPSLHSAAPGNSGNELTDWEDPCGSSGCTLQADCNPNADTLVEFNFTIMRDAQQGFFDIAVNFNDIFCSAKLDSCYTDGAGTCTEAIELLHGDQASEGRQETVVSAFACTSGEGKDTDLLIQAPTVTCDGGVTFTLDLETDGNDTVVNGPNTLRYAVYRGSEELECGENVSCGKEYLNFAINLGDLQDQGLTNCALQPYLATAVERGDSPDFSAAFSSYPFVQFSGHTSNVSLLSGSVPQQFAHPLNGSNSQVQTVYEESDPGVSSMTRYPGGA